MKIRTLAFISYFLAATCAASAAHAQVPTLRVGLPSLSMFTIVYHIAQDKGFFEREGVNVELNHFESGSINIRSLVARAVDVADVETGLILSAIANGADGLRIIATHSKRLHFAFYAKNDIKDLKGMYGRTFAISGIGGLPHLVMLALFERAGLDPDRVQLLTVGGTGARLSALIAGKVDATLGEFSPVVEGNPGINRLMVVSQELPLYMAQGIAVWDDTLNSKRDALERFLRGLIKATRWSYENKAEMIEASRKHLPASAEELGKIFDFYTLARVWAINGEVDVPSVVFMQNLGLKTKTQTKEINLEKVLNLDLSKSVLGAIGSRDYPAKP
jgi:NitT/TauT family transport system substrate-binding protein